MRATIVFFEADDDSWNVQNQRHPPIAEHGRPGQRGDLPEVGLQALDDDLLLREQLVDEQTGTLTIGLDDHQQSVEQLGVLGLDVEQFVQPDDRNEFVAQSIQLTVLPKRAELLALDLNGLDDRDDRNNVDL